MFRFSLLPLLLLMMMLAPQSHGDAFTEREVTLRGAGNVTIAGTLTLPQHSTGQRVPGMVLVAGSGPTDRNGNSRLGLHTDLLKQLADVLAQHGIASLRYDKRGIGASQKQPIDALGLAAFYAWENFVDDTVHALRWLQEQPGVDPARTGMLGHSEGGLLVLQAADHWKGASPPPRVLVLVSTPGRPIDEGIHDQLARLLKLQGATQEQTRFFLDKNDAIATAIKKTGRVPDDVPPGLALLYPAYLGRFLQSQFAVQPIQLAARFHGSVLILQGAQDVQVSPDKDARPLFSARSGRSGTRSLVIVPGASHNLKLVRSEADVGLNGDVAPQAQAAVTSWLTTHLAGEQKNEKEN